MSCSTTPSEPDYLDEDALFDCYDEYYVEFDEDFDPDFEDDFDANFDEDLEDIDFLEDFDEFEFDEAAIDDGDDYIDGYEQYLTDIGYYDGLGDDGVKLYEVDLENFDLDGFDPTVLDTGFFDLDRNPLVRCFRVENCVVMRSEQDYDDGESVDVRYNGQNVLFFNDDRWRFTFTGTALSALYLLPIAVGYQLWLLAAWKRDQERIGRRAEAD